MRIGRLVPLVPLLLPAWLACNPIDISDPAVFDPGTQFTIDIVKPDANREVSRGTLVEIEWAVANTTGLDATIDIFLRNRSNFNETLLMGGERLTGVGETRSLDWDTALFEPGEYSIVGRVQVGDRFKEAGSAGRITVNTPPEWTFTAPLVDVGLVEPPPDPNDPNDPNDAERDPNREPIATISWIAFDPDGDGTASLEADLNADHTDGDEIVLRTVEPTTTEEEQTFDWNGNDADGNRVAAGTYIIYARFVDPFSEEQSLDAPGRITITDEPNQPTFVAGFSQPAEDTEFLVTTPSLDILYSVDEAQDAIVDLKIDLDDNHENGNETTILAQELITAGTTDQLFAWNGEDENLVRVDDGIYRLYMVINRGAGTPQIQDADGLILRRSDANRPLIAILEPNVEESTSSGSFVTIRWRDAAPTEAARITIALDDDETPDELNETGDDERVILEDREAAGTGVLDTFAYQVPADLPTGTYHVFAYIDRNGVAPFDHISVAAGTIEVE